MRVLSEFRERYPQIDELINAAALRPQVQGVVISVNPTILII